MAHSSQSPEVVNQRAKIKRTFIGHKQRIFHLCKTADGRSMISASEDGTCKVWDLASRKCSATLVHNRDAEALRATFFPDERTICTGGSDGAVYVWKRPSLDDAAAYNKLARLDHGEDAQIYACEPVASSENDGGIELLTAADNRIFIWDIQRSERPSAVYDFHRIQSFDVPNESKSSNSQSSPTSIDADPSQQGAASAGIQPFGGERNPDDLVFVFDVKMCPVHTNIISAAMSDATIRLIDVRMRQQPMQYSLSLEGASDYGTGGQKFGHATSVNWATDAGSLLVSLGCGRIAQLDMRMSRVRALLSGHRGPCYGAMFAPPEVSHHHCLSWSSDCTIRLWDVNSGAEQLCMEVKDYNILHAVWSNTSGSASTTAATATATAKQSLGAFPYILCGGSSSSSSSNSTSNSSSNNSGSQSTESSSVRRRPWNSFIGVPIYEISIDTEAATLRKQEIL